MHPVNSNSSATTSQNQKSREKRRHANRPQALKHPVTPNKGVAQTLPSITEMVHYATTKLLNTAFISTTSLIRRLQTYGRRKGVSDR
jgi:hypothetical protein